MIVDFGFLSWEMGAGHWLISGSWDCLGQVVPTTVKICLHVAVGENGLGVESPLDGLEIGERELRLMIVDLGFLT